MRTFSQILVLSTVALCLCGCSDDECPTCPTCPEPTCSNDLYDGRLYVSMAFPSEGGSMGIYVIDTKTEELVDSIIFETTADDAVVSSDGKYLATTDARRGLRVFDAATFDVLWSMHLRAAPQFVHDDEYLLCHREKSWLYSVPDFQLIHEDTVQVGYSVPYSRSRNSFFAGIGTRPFYEYSLDSLKVVQMWYPKDMNGEPYSIRDFDMNSDNTLLYALVICRRGSAYITYDLSADSLIKEFPLYGYVGGVCANPVSGEVYVTDPGAVLPSFTPGTIYVFDGWTGEYLHGISLYGYFSDSWYAMSAWKMTITPDGSQLYVATGHEGRDSGTVLRIDTRTQRVESVIFPDIDRYPRRMAVGPKP